MFDLARDLFAKQGDRIFLEKTRGVLVVSEAVFKKKHKDIQEEKWFLFWKRQEALHEPPNFLLTHKISNEEVFLTEKTTVTLFKIEISERLFFVLLKKTMVTVEEGFSITEHVDNEDCIRGHGMARNRPFCLEIQIAVSSLVLENIKRMPLNSIGCSLKSVSLRDTELINILPKLRINEDCEIEEFELVATRREHVAEVLAQEKPFCVGRVRKIGFEDYAVGVITKMSLEDCGFEWLCLAATRREHVVEVFAQENPFCVGGVKIMWLWDYAVGVITKMSLEDCGVEDLRLTASEEAHVAEVLKKENPFCVGRVRKICFEDYAVGVITKMSLEDCGVEDLRLTASEEAHVAEVLKQENPFCVGRVRKICFEDYAVGVITKMSPEDCEIEDLRLYAPRKEHVAAVLKQKESFCVWRVKNMALEGYAGNVITKMIFHEDNTMEGFVLDGNKDQLSRILRRRDNSIDIGRIRLDGFRVPEREVRRKLRYVLTDRGRVYFNNAYNPTYDNYNAYDIARERERKKRERVRESERERKEREENQTELGYTLVDRENVWDEKKEREIEREFGFHHLKGPRRNPEYIFDKEEGADILRDTSMWGKNMWV
ncbi:MAG: uncharacterized protein A8A55_2789 [Amphiamblys sp. WSBS2006]|nr:MAG: uncharacterized protein A8A55_2789 [Amphiamblys sp. WSBS2006]